MSLLLALIAVAQPGDTLWTRVFDRGWDERPSAVMFDSRGNVVVTGYSFRKETDFDFLVLKYDSLGNLLWSRTFGAPLRSEDRIWAACLDRNDNIYVTGGSIADPARNWDYMTARYMPDGETAWMRRLDSEFHEEDKPAAIAVDDSGFVYVTGAGRGRDRDWDFLTVKYSPQGETLWTRRFDGPAGFEDMAAALSIDSAGNIVVAGKSASKARVPEIAAVKYSPHGKLLWSASARGSGQGHNWASTVRCVRAGRVLFGGTVSSQGSGYDFALVELDAQGRRQRLTIYDGTGHSNDMVNALALDSSGSVYLAGPSMGIGTFSDYCLARYRPDGETCWIRRIDGAAHAEDRAWAVAVGDSDRVFVTGGMTLTRPYESIVTQAYASAGDSLWTAQYGNPTGNCRGTSIAAGRGRIAVAGYAYQRPTDCDIVALVYRQ
jgi:uncharacterized delta-60 repeat protein